ncbi:glycosyltransferase family 9 protein [Dokdonia sinensis]|uniref:Glycosyltransferase family 9 protein n=1 Tax=Dokdonia sinensis TaxID=2479847 RepID=A0A3M0FZ76_9FLAO|nr:glycosyltransferase family 9 protein [Dokdonia sinensis]RMB57974.1 glycosyltransferase family 9 protein [Dokdonia sinensis]
MATQPHILIIRLSAMGDVAMCAPVVYAFAKAYPEVKISFLSKPFFKPLVEAIPGATFIPAEVEEQHKGIPGILRLSSQLKQQNLTAVVDLHNVLRSKMLRKFLRVPGTRITKGRTAKKALTRAHNKVFEQLETTIERYVEAFKKQGYLDVVPRALPKPQMLPVVKAFTEPYKGKWMGIAPFAAHEGKQYPLELIQEVIEDLDSSGDVSIFLFGSPKESSTLDGLSESCTSVTVLGGLLSFEEELNLIAHLDVMLSMDSGNGHLAAMYGVPTVTLWGVTHPYAGFAPFGQEEHCLVSDREQYPLIPTSVFGNKVPDGYEDVMRTIVPETVVKKVTSLL